MAATTGTSFLKRGQQKLVNIPGSRPSLHNNQLLISSGIPSFDNVIGGGLAVGTMLMIEEDTYGSYSRLMLKYFLAEGAMCQHHLCLASADTPPQQLMEELPGPIIDDPGSTTSSGGGDQTDMRIAWRYQKQPQVQSTATGMKFGHYYDLSKVMEKNTLDNTKSTLIDLSEEDILRQYSCNFMKSSYSATLDKIRELIEHEKFGTNSTSSQRNILRICLHSLGSPLWGQDPSDPDLCRFLYALKSLLRSAYATCVITVPTHLMEDGALPSRLERLCDLVVRLEAFVGSDKEKNPAYRDYHGLFHIKKLPRLNSLVCHTPETLDLAFKLRKKKFMIEKLHLPPELSDTASRSQEDPVPQLRPGTAGCAGGRTNKNIDF